MTEKYQLESSKNENLTKAAEKSQSMTEDGKCLIDEIERVKRMSALKLNPKLAQIFFNYMNENSLKLRFHLYYPYPGKYENKEMMKKENPNDPESWKYCMWHKSSTKISSTNSVTVQAMVSSFMTGKKVKEVRFGLTAGADKMISCKMGGYITKISMNESSARKSVKIERYNL